MDYISHHALHSHIPIHHYTNHTAVTIHSLALIVSPHLHLIHTHTFKQHSHMHSPRSLVLAPADISEHFPCILLPVPGARRVRSRARSVPGARRVRSRARSVPEARRVRSRARSVPGARRVRSRARSVPGARRVRSRARSVPGLRRVRSRGRSGPLAWRAERVHPHLFSVWQLGDTLPFPRYSPSFRRQRAVCVGTQSVLPCSVQTPCWPPVSPALHTPSTRARTPRALLRGGGCRCFQAFSTPHLRYVFLCTTLCFLYRISFMNGSVYRGYRFGFSARFGPATHFSFGKSPPTSTGFNWR